MKNEMQRKGGLARAAKLSARRRREIAKKAGQVGAAKRWRMSREEWRLVALLRHYASLNGRTLTGALDEAITKEKFYRK